MACMIVIHDENTQPRWAPVAARAITSARSARPCPAEDDLLAHDLGDPAEASLQVALHYIRFGRCPHRAADVAHQA